MVSEDADWRSVDLPDGRSISVPNESPVGAAFSTSQAINRANKHEPSRLGFLGRQLWERFPECRVYLSEIINSEAEDARESRRKIHPVDPMKCALDAFWYPLVSKAFENLPSSRLDLEKYLLFVRDVYLAESPDWEDTQTAIRFYVIDKLADEEYIAVVAEIDPAVADLVISETTSK